MIQVENITFNYPGSKYRVFTDFNMHLEPGRIYGLLGKNGTGKSTLLYLMSGVLRAQKGRVLFNGIPTAERRTETLRETFLVPEEFELEKLNLTDMIRRYSDFYPRFSEDILRKCFRDFELPEDFNPAKLSMGQKKKVYMSFALASRTRLILMDEPTNGLDIPSKSLFRKVVAENMTDESTLVISTHQVHDVESLLDHVIIMDRSRILLDASTADITSRYAFTFCQPQEMDDSVIYAEPSLQGNRVVSERRDDEPETNIDMELLFNAVVNGKVSLISDDEKKQSAAEDEAQEEPATKPTSKSHTFGRLLYWRIKEGLKPMVSGWTVAAVIVAVVMLFIKTMSGDPWDMQSAIGSAWASTAICVMAFMGLGFLNGMKTKQQKIREILIPASSWQKFGTRWVALVVNFTISLIVFAVVMDIIQMAFCLVTPFGSVSSFIFDMFTRPQHFLTISGTDVFNVLTPWQALSWTGLFIVTLAWGHTLMILGSVVFNKQKFLSTAACFLLISWVLSGSGVWALVYASDTLRDMGEAASVQLANIIANIALWSSLALTIFNVWLSHRIYSRIQGVNTKWMNL